MINVNVCWLCSCPFKIFYLWYLFTQPNKLREPPPHQSFCIRVLEGTVWLEEWDIRSDPANKHIIYNLAGTKGDKFTIDETWDLAGGGPYGNDLRSSRSGSGTAGGKGRSNRGPHRRGEHSKESQMVSSMHCFRIQRLIAGHLIGCFTAERVWGTLCQLTNEWKKTTTEKEVLKSRSALAMQSTSVCD